MMSGWMCLWVRLVPAGRPVMVVVLGGIVGTIVVALFLPMVRLCNRCLTEG